MLILSLCIVITLLDQVTKVLAKEHLPAGAVTVWDGLFDLRYVQNTGAAWGIFSGMNAWLVVLSLVMLAVLVRFRRYVIDESLQARIAMGLMLGGITGNLLDRMRWSYVVDFFDFHWRGRHFPAFNIADAAICTGVFLYIGWQILSDYRHHREHGSGRVSPKNVS